MATFLLMLTRLECDCRNSHRLTEPMKLQLRLDTIEIGEPFQLKCPDRESFAQKKGGRQNPIRLTAGDGCLRLWQNGKCVYEGGIIPMREDANEEYKFSPTSAGDRDCMITAHYSVRKVEAEVAA